MSQGPLGLGGGAVRWAALSEVERALGAGSIQPAAMIMIRATVRARMSLRFMSDSRSHEKVTHASSEHGGATRRAPSCQRGLGGLRGFLRSRPASARRDAT